MSPERKPSHKVRVVVDTNVIISGLNFPGKEFRVLELVREGRVDTYLSLVILEVERVLRDKFRWPASDLETALRLLRGWTTPVQPKVTVTVVRRDEADNRVLECALACQAESLVTGDRDLCDLGGFQGIRIVTAAQFLPIIEPS